MSGATNKIDSNIVGLSYAEEIRIGVIPDGTSGSNSNGSFTTTAKWLAGTLIFNEQDRSISCTVDVAAAEDLVFARITRTRAAVPLVDVGTQISISSDDPEWDSFSDPDGVIGRWDAASAPAGTTTLTFSASLVGLIADGDTFLVEYDDNTGFTAPGSILLTVTTLADGTAVWRALEPNSYGEFGADITTTARNPINASRQRKRGVITNLEASAEFNHDVTETTLTRLMQGFFFADAHEKESTNRFNGTAISFTSMVTQTITVADSTLTPTGSLLRLSGFANNADSLRLVTATPTATTITVDGAVLVSETSLPDNAYIEVVGFELTNAATALTVVGNKVLLTNTTDNLLLLDLNIGEWIFIGGDAASTAYTNNVGYARIKSVTDDVITLEQPTWATPVDEAGGSIDLRIFFGKFIRNENDADLITCRSYHLERTLGKDANDTQAEYIKGAVADKFTMSMPTAESLTADLNFMGLTSVYTTGSEGLKAGTRIAAPEEDAYNTANDIYDMRVYVQDDTLITPGALFGFASEASITITNNVSTLGAIGVLGGFATNIGTFEVGGDITAYFNDISIMDSILANDQIGFYVIGAKSNSGFVYDMPELSIAGGRANVEQDNAITIPIENLASEGDEGYTLSGTYFTYLPTIAMPSADTVFV